MRVCIIGPITPFRSGIARHTTALARELTRRPDIEVSIYSFSRQYPSLLFPGVSERNPDVRPPDGVEADFCIDSINPLNWWRTAAKILQTRPDLAVIPAWTFFLAPCLGVIAHALRRRGVSVLMIVHNAADHETARWKTALSRFQLRQASRFLTHNAGIASDLERLVPQTPITICPHPVYEDYPEPKGDLPRTAALELLFFGLIRSYKGLDIALNALAASGLEDVRLSVVGEFWQGQGEIASLIDTLGLTEHVELTPRYVPDQEAAEYFARCDAVIAPYRSATGSGVIGLALRYHRPVIASDVAGLSEAIDDGATGWLFPAGDSRALATLLRTHVSRAAAEAMHPALEARRAALTWNRFAEAVLHPGADRCALSNTGAQ